jgi:hypothetical protein
MVDGYKLPEAPVKIVDLDDRVTSGAADSGFF